MTDPREDVEEIVARLFRHQRGARSRGAYTDCACPTEAEVDDALVAYGERVRNSDGPDDAIDCGPACQMPLFPEAA